jgi:YihY family inner membrane protein
VAHSLASVVRRRLAAVDAYQRDHRWMGFPLAVVKKLSDDRAGGQASLIAYYGFFALFPLLLVFVTILGLTLHGDPSLRQHVINDVNRDFPSLSGYVTVPSVHGGGLKLGVGILLALWAGFGVTQSAQNAFNTVWDVPHSRRPNAWRSRLRGLGILSFVGVVTIVSTGASSLYGRSGSLAVVWAVVGVVVPLALNVVAFLVAFRVLTALRLLWRDVLPGAVLASAAWTLLQEVGGYYTRHVIAHASRLYGTFAIVIGLLTWIHLGARVTLMSAEVNVVRSRRLWPRRLFSGLPTEADRRVLALKRDVYDGVDDPLTPA